jgi:hypothetical protein
VPTIDEWQALAIVCGALIALLTLAGLAWKVVRRMWKIVDTAKRVADQILGTPAVTNPDGSTEPARPGFNERLNRIENTQARIERAQQDLAQRLTDHLDRHDDGVNVPNGVPMPRRRSR